MKPTVSSILLATSATLAQASDTRVPAGIPEDLRSAAGPKALGPVLHEDYFPKADLDTSCLDEAFDAHHVALPCELLPAEGRFQPMIQEGETGFVPSYHFTRMAKTLAIMNKLAYTRGQDYRFGHELTYQGSLAGWTLKNIKARRGWNALDPNAGFVAHNKELHTVAIVMHGSINTADWITNFKAHAVRLDAPHPLPGKPGEEVRNARLPFVGYAHAGFLEKYLSCQEEVMSAVDELLTSPDMTAEEKRNTKFYVSGHSQGAALAQLLTLHLCLHLRKHYGPDFINAKENRVHAWMLASPTGLDETAVAFAEGWIGKANMVVQNTWLDPVPNAGYSPSLIHFQALGTPIMQSSAVAAFRAARAHRKAVETHLANGDPKEAVLGAALGGTLGGLMKAGIAAQHMGTDDVNYRGVGTSYAFDPEMVDQTMEDLKVGLQMAFDHRQAQLRSKANAANSTWGRVTSWFN